MAITRVSALNLTGRVRVYSVIILALVVCLSACSTNARDRPDITSPEGVIEKTAFINLLADIQLIEAASKNRLWRNDDVEKRLGEAYNEVFQKHGVSEAQFKTSHTWWWNHPVAMKGVLLEVTEKITQLETEAR